MTDTTQAHWQQVHAAKPADTVSWFQSEPTPSLAMITATGLGPEAAVIDVGGGASCLVDRLLDRGIRRITVLDVSNEALDIARARLGDRAGLVAWQVADITAWTPPPAAFDLWHDRAVLHFLVRGVDRRAYVRAMSRGLKPGGYAILAPFSLTGPERCSGLLVQRYSPEILRALVGPGFELIEARPETHRTPGGAAQDFVWCLFRKGAE
jgi:ubiquinone/menaquinone biosynthesis C-methylase UbiE